jgi:Na+-translocating ferredoxin:NAD+ oxidoreductase RnfC subunit
MMLWRPMTGDFSGGIYLAPLGGIPPLDRIEPVDDYPGDLRLPLGFGAGRDMRLLVKKGDAVESGTLLATHASGYHIYAPRTGIVGDKTEVWLANKPNQPALLLHPLPDNRSTNLKPRSPTLNPVSSLPEILKTEQSSTVSAANTHKPPAKDFKYSAEAVWQAIERAGLIVPAIVESLSRYLRELDALKINLVVANAAPLESSLNAPVAMLHHYPEQIFAGLSILKRWLGADMAILAYTHGINFDYAEAARWGVRCVAIGEKYPQARNPAVLKTLENMGWIKPSRAQAAAVFDCQLLRQVERAVLVGQLPTTRIVTVSGDGVKRPGHFLAPIGLPVIVLLERAEILPNARCVVEGSSLAGVAIDPEQAVVTALSENYIVVRSVPQDQPQPCVRCGWCIHDCPARIDPAKLYQLARSGRYAVGPEYRMGECIECGICTYVCPSHLQILDHIRMMKHQWRHRIKRA